MIYETYKEVSEDAYAILLLPICGTFSGAIAVLGCTVIDMFLRHTDEGDATSLMHFSCFFTGSTIGIAGALLSVGAELEIA